MSSRTLRRAAGRYASANGINLVKAIGGVLLWTPESQNPDAASFTMTPRADGWYTADTPGFPSIKFVTVAGRDLLLARAGLKQTAAIPISSTVKTLVDVVLPRSFGRTWPRRLTDQVRYTLPRNAPSRASIGSTVVRGPTLRIATDAPVRIASPVAGSGWIDGNGCCEDPTAQHRNTLLAADGSYRTRELFAIDWSARSTARSSGTAEPNSATP